MDLLHSVSYFLFFFTDFDAISSGIDEVLSINTSGNVFIFRDLLNIYYKDWKDHSGGTDRIGELSCNIPI